MALTRNQIQAELFKLISRILDALIADDSETSEDLIQCRYDLMDLVRSIDAPANKAILPPSEEKTE